MYGQRFLMWRLAIFRNTFAAVICFFSFTAISQPFTTGSGLTRAAVIDSLNIRIADMAKQQDSLKDLLRNQRESISNLEEEKDKLETENKNLKEELNGALGDNLQSSHTKSILFVFNVIVGVFLLIAIIWMFSRKKGADAVVRSSGPALTNNNGGTNGEGYDHKLERIEKLGNLRDKGLLTDDEFNLQKKQILADRG